MDGGDGGRGSGDDPGVCIEMCLWCKPNKACQPKGKKCDILTMRKQGRYWYSFVRFAFCFLLWGVGRLLFVCSSFVGHR